MTKKSLKKQIEEGIKICFSVCYDNTEDNRRIHEAFKEFAVRESDNNYLLAIKQLLTAYSEDWKYTVLNERISNLKQDVSKLKTSIEEKQESNPSKGFKTFGGNEKDE